MTLSPLVLEEFSDALGVLEQNHRFSSSEVPVVPQEVLVAWQAPVLRLDALVAQDVGSQKGKLGPLLRQLVRIDFCSWAGKCRSSTQLVAASFHTCSGSSDRLAERSEDGGRMPDGDGVPRPEPIGDAMWRASRGPAKRESLQTKDLFRSHKVSSPTSAARRGI